MSLGYFNNKRGVTFTELAVVVTILGIMGVLMIPGIGNWLRHYRLRGAASDMASKLQAARMEAITTGFDYRVTVTTSSNFPGGKYVIERHSGGWKPAKTIAPDGTVSMNEYKDVRIASVNGANPIIFSPNGTVNNSSTIQFINRKNESRSVNITIAGRIRVP